MNLLIVDDDRTISEGLSKRINRKAVRIDTIISAGSAEEARRVFAEQPVDITLCDIEMPNENGVSLIEWVRENHPETLCIFLTAHADFEYAQKGISLGVFEYVLQPAPVRAVEEVLRKAVEQLRVDRRMRMLSDYGDVLQKQKMALVRSMVSDLLTESGQFYENTLRKLSQLIPEAAGLESPKLLLVKPVLPEISSIDREMKCFVMTNILSEILGLSEDKVLYTWNENGEYIFIISDDAPLAADRFGFFRSNVDRILSGAYSVYAAECGRMSHEALQDTLGKLRHLCRENVTGREELRILAEEDVSSLGRIQSSGSGSPMDEKARLLSEVYSYIRENITRDITPQEIAEHVHFSSEYFSKKFRKETGTGIKEYILEEKFNYAKNCLKNTDMPVSDIATSIGYSNLSHFTYMFRKRTGLSPTEYRRKKNR